MNDPLQNWPRIQTVGLSGLVVRFGPAFDDRANRAAIAFRAAVDAEKWPEVEESSSTLVSAFFRVDLAEHDVSLLSARLQEVLDQQDWLDAPYPANRSRWTSPASFGGTCGPQLEEAAALAGLDPDAAIASLAAAQLRVLTLGFAPGQPYLGSLDANWQIPRQSQITKAVPAGALVVAVQQFCLFTASAPTGWRHVGQTVFRPFRPDAEDPCPLRPGDEVHFTQVSETELESIEAKDNCGNGGAERVQIG